MATQKRIEDAEEWALLGVDDLWPQYDEDDYYRSANTQLANAEKAAQSSAAMSQARGVVDTTMEGQTADAATARFTADGARLEQRAITHEANAVGTAMMGASHQATKESINAIMATHTAQKESIKARMVADPLYAQHQAAEDLDLLRGETSTALQTVARDNEQTQETLKAGLNSGETPSVPSTMPSPPPGASGPREGLDSGLDSQIDGLLGKGGMDMSQMAGMAGMAQGLLSPLTGALQSPPGADTLNQAGQQGFQLGQQAIQALLGQAGSGQAELTPEQVEELIAGQGGDSTDGMPGGHEPNAERDTESAKLENPEPPKEDVDAEPKADAEAVETEAETETASAAPSPAAEPVSAAPPTSALPPTTELTSDSGAATTAQAASGTHLSGAATAAPAASSVSLGGAATAPAGAAGAGFGAPVMGVGAPVMGGAPVQSAARGSTAQGPIAGGEVRGGEPGAAAPGAVGAIPAPGSVSQEVSGTHQRARGVLAYLREAYRAAGIPGDVAVAVLEDDLLVYSTSVGLGVVPEGLLLPAGVLPLAEFPSLNTAFRIDHAGAQPGHAIHVADIVGLIPRVEVIFTTAETDHGFHVPDAILRGAEPVSGAVSRDMLAALPAEAISEVVNTAELLLGIPAPLPTAEEARADLRGALEAGIAAKVVGAWLLAEAKAGSGYAARQLAWLVGVPA